MPAVPAVPGSRRILVSFDGSRYAYDIPPATTAGRVAVRLASRGRSAKGYHFVVGRLLAGKTLADVVAMIRRGPLTSVPRWFQIISVLPAPPGSDATWGVTLAPGRYALVPARRHERAARRHRPDGQWLAMSGLHHTPREPGPGTSVASPLLI